MKILYTAFNSKNNSSKILLDNIKGPDKNKLYLSNRFDSSVLKLKKEIINNNYDLIISFGECPPEYNTIKLEKQEKKDNKILKTNCKSFSFIKNFENNGFKCLISNDAGNYLCNNLYFNGLKIIENNNLNTLMLFIHILKIKNIDIEKLASIF